MEPLVSILVPVWGTERYIEKCMRSLVSQTLKRIEIVVVDDCTPDNAMEIVRRVAAEHPEREVRIIRHEQNKGLMEARKTAVREARAPYVVHVDSDDWADEGLCETLCGAIMREDADVVFADAWFDYPGRVVYQAGAKRDWETRGHTAALLSWRIEPQVWNKIYKREACLRAIGAMEPGYDFSEDFYFNAHLFYFARKAAYLPQAFYHYRLRPESIVGSAGGDLARMMQPVENMKLVERFYASRPDGEKYAPAVGFAKLFAKKPLALTLRRDLDRMWIESFPEADRLIWRNGSEKLQYKTVEWLLHKRMHKAKNLLLRLLESGKKMAGMVRK